MKYLILYVVASLILLGQGAFASEEKAKMIERVTRVMEEVRKISVMRPLLDQAEMDRRLEVLLADKGVSLEELFKIALISHVTAYPQKAEDVPVDMPYDRMFWIAARRVSEIPGKDAAMTLERIRRHRPMDAGDGLMFKELVQREAALGVKEGTK